MRQVCGACESALKYKAGWLRGGTLDGAPCTHAALVDLRAGTGTGVGREREVGKALEQLHLDHERPLHATCHRWRGCGNARGAAVVGRRTGWRSAVPRPVWGVRGRVCAVSMQSTARRRGCSAAVCGPRVLPSVVVGRGWWCSGFLDRERVYVSDMCIVQAFRVFYCFVCESGVSGE